MKNIFVITGCAGAGKTTLIDALRKKGFCCAEEASREVIREGGLPGSVDFALLVMKKRIEQYNSAKDKVCFFDRGIPDILGYLTVFDNPVPKELSLAAKKYKYNKKVFFTEPWEDIFKNDSERMESFKIAEKVSVEIKKAYVGLGYEVVSLPKCSVAKRVEFISKQAGALK